MCDNHERDGEIVEETFSRRSFVKLGMASTIGLGLAMSAGNAASDANVKIPPLPENVLTPDQALERLMAGNQRYASGQSRPSNFEHDREVLTKGQNPYACILGCSDSRVSPEFCFDEQRGDLFIARVAGNYLTTDFIATLEYAAAMLHTPLFMVLGHESCGAAKAAIDAVEKNQQFPGHIQALASALAPAVRAVKGMPGDRYENAIKMNVVLNVERLRQKTPILNRLVKDKKIRVVGGIYSLTTGKVDLVA